MPKQDTDPLSDRDSFERLAAAHEAYVEELKRPKPRWDLVLGVLVLCATIGIASCQVRQASQQFERTARQTRYSDIVSGMASESVGVQVNALRELVQWVRDPENFDDDEEGQTQSATNAAQALTAFIQDESETPAEGLSNYRDPQPVIMSRALGQLLTLMGRRGDEVDLTAPTFPSVNVDLARGNFHGAPFSDFAPEGGVYAVGSDWRGATVTGWDLSKADGATFASSFFTCADLQVSNLGNADVGAADFTGANLRGADFSDVRNLTSDQVSGALIGPYTRLPSGVEVVQPGWGYRQTPDGYVATPACRHLMDEMTNLPAGSGYSRRLPCSGKAKFGLQLSEVKQSVVSRVCALRPN